MNKTPMKNTHQEHFEDYILTGDFRALDAILQDFHLSTKVDGSPAVVFGTNPANGKWFVSTKSAFNKVKIKLCHSHQEIDALFNGQVAEILHSCFDYLPRTNSILQCDFIGFSGSDEYTPNTITYKFPEVVSQKIIVSVHTEWATEGELKDAYVVGSAPHFESDDCVLFVNNGAHLCAERDDFVEVISFIKQMGTLVEFANPKEAKEIEKQINAAIREGREIDPDDFENPAVISLWKLAESVKLDFLHFCRANTNVTAFLGQEQVNHEGFVLRTDDLLVKFVNREVFSYANFNQGRFQVAH
jgi:hypothetical protein